MPRPVGVFFNIFLFCFYYYIGFSPSCKGGRYKSGIFLALDTGIQALAILVGGWYYKCYSRL